tara:strand:- start:548 stop:868 length:321 start_codon:yes stop_codon:yes gene_type:complete
VIKMSWRDILKNEELSDDDFNTPTARRGAPKFPTLINVPLHDEKEPHNYYSLQEVIENAPGTEPYGVYYADWPNHPESVLHLELEEAKQYEEDEDERGYDGPKWRD